MLAKVEGAPRYLDEYLARCRTYLIGTGRVEALHKVGTRLLVPEARADAYSDAQLDDYTGLPRRAYPNRPPLYLSLRARFSRPGWPVPAPHPVAPNQYFEGTAGFGFWNSPVESPSRVPARPQAVWFFYSAPPSNMPLAQNVPGYGLKAACADAGRFSSLAWLPGLPLIMLASRVPTLYRLIWPRIQRSLGIQERLLDLQPVDMTTWHRYELEWRRDGATWWVDGRKVFETDQSPRGPLGFVTWVDNQYTVLTPQGHIEFGHIHIAAPEWLDLDDVTLYRL